MAWDMQLGMIQKDSFSDEYKMFIFDKYYTFLLY